MMSFGVANQTYPEHVVKLTSLKRLFEAEGLSLVYCRRFIDVHEDSRLEGETDEISLLDSKMDVYDEDGHLKMSEAEQDAAGLYVAAMFVKKGE